MGRDLVAYVQIKEKDGWKMAPLYRNRYLEEGKEFTYIVYRDHGIYEDLRDAGYVLKEDEQYEIDKIVYGDDGFEGLNDEPCNWLAIGFGTLKYLAVTANNDDIDEEYEYNRVEMLNKIVNLVNATLVLTDNDFKPLDEVRLVFYLSY